MTPVAVYGLTKTPVTLRTGGCVIDSIHLGNPSNAAGYLQVFDLAPDASLTVGTTTPTFVFAAPTVSCATWPKCQLQCNFGLRVAFTTTATGNTDASTAGNLVLALE